MRSKGIQTPALVIALGTTATKAARELCEQLLTMEQDDRDAVAVVTIDTDSARPEFADLLAENPGKFHAFNAAIRVSPQVDYADNLSHRGRRHIFMPNYVPSYYDYGAGGIRNHGHVALTYQLDDIYKPIQDALASIKLLPSGQGHVVTDSVQVYVVAFLGGGTGSGIVADLAVILRNMLSGEMEGQRLLLFGILPLDHIPGAGSNEESWRRSNATAALLEILATGLAAAGRRDGFYRKRLLSRSYVIPKGPLFNEMFLTGRTNLDDVDKVARMIGLDVFQRITDASGIGDSARTQSPDLKNLKDTDDEDLPTNISASCPIEVRFPTDEICDAFAYLTAGRMLKSPTFVGSVPPEPVPDDPDKTHKMWRNKLEDYAKPSLSSRGATGQAATLAKALVLFEADQFVGTGPNGRRMLWDDAREQIGRFPAELERVRDAIEAVERKRIDTIPEEELQVNQQLSYPAQRLNHLSLLRQEYAYMLGYLRDNPAPAPNLERNEDLERRLDSILPFGLDRILPPNPITENMEEGRAYAVAQDYNDIIKDAWEYQRYTTLVEALERLHKWVSDLYAAGKRDIEQANSVTVGQSFVERSLASQAWQGRLARAHPHIIGLFEPEVFHKMQEARDLPQLPALVGLYRWSTITPKGNGENVLAGSDKPLDEEEIESELPANWVDGCRRALAKVRRQDLVEMKGANLSEGESRDALAAGPERVSERVLDYCRQRYRDFFQRKNLFELLQVGYAAETGYAPDRAWREVPNLMRMHLVQMSRVLRLMLKADKGLWRWGPETVRGTLYLGVNWRNDAYDETMIKTLANEVRFRGPLDSPMVSYAQDPHRMQMNLALHAISIRTIPMFFLPEVSLMSEYLRHEKIWLGGWQPGADGGMTRMTPTAPLMATALLDLAPSRRGMAREHRFMPVRRWSA